MLRTCQSGPRRICQKLIQDNGDNERGDTRHVHNLVWVVDLVEAETQSENEQSGGHDVAEPRRFGVPQTTVSEGRLLRTTRSDTDASGENGTRATWRGYPMASLPCSESDSWVDPLTEITSRAERPASEPVPRGPLRRRGCGGTDMGDWGGWMNRGSSVDVEERVDKDFVLMQTGGD